MFDNAKAIWLARQPAKLNRSAGFSAKFDGSNSGDYTIHIAAADYYKLYVNGKFVSYGPARTAPGFFRVDEIDITNAVKKGENTVFILEVSYNVNGFANAMNNPFVTAEVYRNGESLVYTGRDFSAHSFPYRVNKVQRYSFQRNFIEVMNIDGSYYKMLEGKAEGDAEYEILIQNQKYIGKSTLPCHYNQIDGDFCYHGDMLLNDMQHTAINANPPFFLKPTEVFKCYKPQELEIDAADLVSRLTTVSFSNNAVKTSICAPKFLIADFGVNAAGFIRLEIDAEEDSEIFLLFDEMLTKGDVDPGRLSCLNCVIYNLSKGSHILETFEPYTLRYLKIFCRRGKVNVRRAAITEVCNPDSNKVFFESSSKELNRIFAAAVNTFKYSATDIFMDCPSRERAGWLCDSYFLGAAESLITGKNAVEHDFLENFLLSKRYSYLPQGMLPMCWPSEHNDGNFIPNWSMWFVLELEQYYLRTNDSNLIEKAKNKVLNLLAYFEKYQNSDGLLEKLDGWVFIEWSRAGEFTQDVNFPTNMLYAHMLECAGRLYGKKALVTKGQAIKRKIYELSFNGEFFIDNAVRENGVLKLTSNMSEVCQYYAFFTGVATVSKNKELFEKLIRDYGPKNIRNMALHKANAFIGHYLRLEMLCSNNKPKNCLREIIDFFDMMATTTGTLWENDSPKASLHHGFASYVVKWILSIAAGYKGKDAKGHRIVEPASTDLEWCNAKIPDGDEGLNITWRSTDGVPMLKCWESSTGKE